MTNLIYFPRLKFWALGINSEKKCEKQVNTKYIYDDFKKLFNPQAVFKKR